MSSGLDVAPDGSIYVADTVGGRVTKYGPDGGPAVADFTQQQVAFNNVMDVAVAGNGRSTCPTSAETYSR